MKSHASPRRLLTLLIAAVLVWGCSDDEAPLARFGDQELTPDAFLSELEFFLDGGQSLEEQDLTPEAFLDRVVRMRLLIYSAERQVPSLAPNDEARLAAFQDDVLRHALIDFFYPEPIRISDADVRAVYDREANEERRLQHLVARRPSVAQRAHDALVAGDPYNEVLARLEAAYPAEVRGVDLGFVRRGHLPPVWEREGWALSEGEVSEPFSTDEGTHVLVCVAIRLTPWETMEPEIRARLEREAIGRRLSDLESQLMSATAFEIDTTSVDFLADRIVTQHDSLAARGIMPSRLTMPRLSDADRERVFFRIMNVPFTLDALASELIGAGAPPLEPGSERESLMELARRRAGTAALQEVARRRGLFDEPELGRKVQRKREELLMSTLLRELFRGLEPSEAEVREYLAAQGQDIPGESGLRLIRERVARDRQAQRLDAYLDTLSVRYELETWPERLPAVMERWNPDPLAGAP